MWPHYRQEGGYLRLAAEANLVNRNTHSNAHINMEIYAKNKNRNLFPHPSVPQRESGRSLGPPKLLLRGEYTHTEDVILPEQDYEVLLTAALSPAS